MQPLIEPHRRQFRDTLEEKMPPEGADAVLAALPASEAEMPANKDFVRAEITEVRAEMIEKFATASTEMKRWVIGAVITLATMMIGLVGVVLAAINTLPG